MLEGQAASSPWRDELLLGVRHQMSSQMPRAQAWHALKKPHPSFQTLETQPPFLALKFGPLLLPTHLVALTAG